jgi:hypothetical protein
MKVRHEKGKILAMTLVHLAAANLFALASAKARGNKVSVSGSTV